MEEYGKDKKNKIEKNKNTSENNKLREKVEKIIFNYSCCNLEELYKNLKTSEEGLDPVEVDEKFEEFGKNTIETSNRIGLLKRIKDSIINPFNIVLIVIIIITFFTDIVIAEDPSYSTVLMLILIVGISAIISFSQTEKYNNAAKKLQSMITNKVDVIRNNIEEEIDIEEVVPGDIVRLASGDMIPGDVRFIETKDLFVDQASLTGESVPVEKFCDETIDGDCSNNVLELKNIGFMGSNIISGSSKAVVLSTGNSTYFGAMAKSLYTENEKTGFEKDIDDISKLLIKFMIVAIPIIFVANLITKSDWLSALMFGITIAVGLIPEMLPVIINSSLAKGAVSMSKKHTIVKRLGAIQTFGQMDILCTDKTGTLTQDKVILEKYIDVTGKEDRRILKHAFLNSYFQTGLKNLMDRAIIARADKDGLEYLKGDYIKEDEIPFDFERRRMSVVLRDLNGKRQLITKGAVDEILSICKYIDISGEVVQLTDDLIKKAKETYEANTNEGLRMIAVAQKNEIHDIETFSVQDENDMVLIGFVGFLDPPKESAISAIEALKNHGVKTIVLTGDSKGVTISVCKKLRIDTSYVLTGTEVDNMSDDELSNACTKCLVFAKLNPFQKKRIVKIFQRNGHTVGYMGDGINDSPPLKQADVGISVDTAVDIAKEVADIILLEKDLNVLEEGVREGRKTYANMIKYLKMATSGNFGNMFSVLIASIFLPFLPLKPIHILVQNILNDFAGLGMPFDNVEEEYIKTPKKLDVKGIKSFMFYFGFLSTAIDILCFAVLWFVFKFNEEGLQVQFQTGWFVFGIISQTFIIHVMRTHKIPFINSKTSKQLNLSTAVIIAVTLVIGFTNIAVIFDLVKLPIIYLVWVAILMLIYLMLAQILKRIYVKKYKQWI